MFFFFFSLLLLLLLLRGERKEVKADGEVSLGGEKDTHKKKREEGEQKKKRGREKKKKRQARGSRSEALSGRDPAFHSPEKLPPLLFPLLNFICRGRGRQEGPSSSSSRGPRNRSLTAAPGRGQPSPQAASPAAPLHRSTAVPRVRVCPRVSQPGGRGRALGSGLHAEARRGPARRGGRDGPGSPGEGAGGKALIPSRVLSR